MTNPQRRLRHGQRPNEQLDWSDTASQSQAVPSELASLKELAARIKEANCRPIEVSTLAAPAILKLIEQVESLSHSAATGEAAPAVLDLPSAIMDIPCEPVAAWGAIGVNYYRLGHRDARHAAADLVLKRADELAALASPAAPLAGKAEAETALRKLCDQLENAKRFKHVATGTSQTHSYLEYEDVSRFVEEARKVLSAPLAAAVPAEEASENEWKKFDGESWIDFGKLVDVLLTNGCYEYARPCNRVDWTQVADWRYAAPAEPAPIQTSALTDDRIREIYDGTEWGRMGSGLVFARAIEREVLARDSITIHRDGMANNSHYRERVFNQILELDAKEGLSRFARLSTPTAPVAADAAVTAPSIDTPEFRAALDAWAQTDCDNAAATADLIAHINRHIAAQAPAGRDADALLDKAASIARKYVGCDHIAAQILELKSHAAEQESGVDHA